MTMMAQITPMRCLAAEHCSLVLLNIKVMWITGVVLSGEDECVSGCIKIQEEHVKAACLCRIVK